MISRSLDAGRRRIQLIQEDDSIALGIGGKFHWGSPGHGLRLLVEVGEALKVGGIIKSESNINDFTASLFSNLANDIALTNAPGDPKASQGES